MNKEEALNKSLEKYTKGNEELILKDCGVCQYSIGLDVTLGCATCFAHEECSKALKLAGTYEYVNEIPDEILNEIRSIIQKLIKKWKGQ